jgi:hypothetical protein
MLDVGLSIGVVVKLSAGVAETVLDAEAGVFTDEGMLIHTGVDVVKATAVLYTDIIV